MHACDYNDLHYNKTMEAQNLYGCYLKTYELNLYQLNLYRCKSAVITFKLESCFMFIQKRYRQRLLGQPVLYTFKSIDGMYYGGIKILKHMPN